MEAEFNTEYLMVLKLNMVMKPSNKSEYFDVIIIGGGPAGSVVGAKLAESGLVVLLLERHPFPRYHIGESLTGLVGNFLREIGLAEEMEKLQFPIKSGMSFIGPNNKSDVFIATESPTWQVRRAEFDQLLLDYAVSKGLTLRYGSVKKIFRDGHKVIGVGYKPSLSNTDLLEHIRCKFIVDASGHGAVLSRNRVAGRRRVDTLWQQLAVFTQFQGVVRDDGEMGNNNIVFYSEPNHWAWFIPTSPTEVSVGVVVPQVVAQKYGETAEDFLQWGIKNISTDLARRLSEAQMTGPVRLLNNYSYRIEPFVGESWLCVGDSHRFLDPVLSLGVSNAITEATFASKAIITAFHTGDFIKPLQEYAAFSNHGYSIASDLIRYFWNFLTTFGRQARSGLRNDIIHLLDGYSFEENELTVLTAMHSTLAKFLPANLPSGDAQSIAGRIKHAYTPGLEAAYIELTSENKLKLSLILNNDDPNFQEAVSDFTETLYADFGRDNLLIYRFIATDALPSFENAYDILNLAKSQLNK